jgi:hypothetical protein
MKSSCVLLIFASVLAVGCAGTNPVAPDSASVASVKPTEFAPLASGRRTFFPPIEPVGISCPSDAPQIHVSSFGRRLDIVFSEVAGARAYEIEITNINGEKARLEVDAPASRAEWYGTPGTYVSRVRTINCGGLGQWSSEIVHSIDDDTPRTPPPPPPPAEPQCMVRCA